MLNNYADSGGGFNSNHGQTARPTETQKQQNLGTSWSYNSQLEGIYYGNEHQPMYMGAYDGSNKQASYPQYPSGTIHQPVPTPVVQCHEACCQHYENRYPINPAPLRYQPSGPLQPPRYSDIPNSDSRQYFPDRRPVQVNLPRKKAYPSDNGYPGITDRHYSQYMGRGQALPVDSRQQMQVMRPQYPAYPHFWGGSRGWAGARMNCPPPSYHQSVNQSAAQLQPGTKITDSSQYMDPSLQKSLNAQHQRGVGTSSGKLDIIRPVPEPKRSTLDSSLQSYDYGYPTGFLPFSEVNKIQGKSLNPQSMNGPCKIPAEKQYHPQQMQYSYQNNERNLIGYGNPSNDPSYPMNYPLSSNDLHTKPGVEAGPQVSGARKLPMHYDSSGKKRQNLDLRQFLETWEDDEDESARLSEPPLPVGSTATPYIVVECSTLESDAAAKLQERFKPLPSSQDCSTKPRGNSPSIEHKRSNEPIRQEEHSERTIIHSDLHSQTSYAPSMPTLLSDSDKSVNFWNGLNKEGDNTIGKGGAFQPLDCSKRDSNINHKVIAQRDSLPTREVPVHKALCSNDTNSSFDALVSFYGDNRRVSGGYDLVEMSERMINSSDKARIDHQPPAELARPCDPRLQQSQHSNNPSIYDKLSPRFSTNNYQHYKGMPTDPFFNYKHPMSSSEKYYGYENSPIMNSNYDYNKFVSEFDNTRLYGGKDAPKDPRTLYGDIQKNPENSLEPIDKSSMPNCFQNKTNLEYTSLEPEQFIPPIIEKSLVNQSEQCSQKGRATENALGQQKTNFSTVLGAGIESQVQAEKTVLVTSQNCPPEIFRMSYSPKKEISHKDNVVTLHSGDQTENNTMTVEVPYVTQYSTLVKLSEEISRTENVDESEEKAERLTEEDKTSTEEIKKPTCFKLKRLPNSKEWTVEGNENTESGVKEGMCSPKTEVIEDGDVLKATVSVSNLNMPSLDDIRDGEESCDVAIVNPCKTKVSEGVLCSNKTSAQPPQLAIVQPMKLVSCEGESSEPNLQNELINEENKTKQALKAFRSFHSHNLNGENFNTEKSITETDCDSQIEGMKADISKHENFRSHKKIQGDFSNSFPNCLSSPNEEFSHSQEVNPEPTKQQYSPFHMYTDCVVNSQIPDFFKMNQRSSSNEKILDKQIPTSPGVEGMFEDINHLTNNQLCHNQIYERKSCNFQDLTAPNMSSFDNHNSHFQSFSSIFADESSNNKGRCDGSVLQMGDKKYLKHLLDDIERQQVSNTLEERVSKLKSNFMNETSSDNKTCQAKKSPPIPPINLKLNESKKVWCITNKDQHLSLSDFSENSLINLTSNSSTTVKETSLMENKNDQENYLLEMASEETKHSCYQDEILVHSDKHLNDIGTCAKIDKDPNFNQLSSSEHTSFLKDIDTAPSQISFLSGIDPTNDALSESPSYSITDFNDTTRICPLNLESNKENHCLSIVKYHPRNEVLNWNSLINIGDSVHQSILIFDEKGTHFPHENNAADTHSVSIAKDIVELLITNVITSRKIVDSLEIEPVYVSENNLLELEKINSTLDENLETVIKFDKSSSFSKNCNDQKHVTKTTEIFIEHEKEHNQHLSVIKAIQSEKHLSSLDETKPLFRSIFSPMPDDGKDNNSLSFYSNTSVTNNLTEEKDAFIIDFIETKDNCDKMDVDVTENSDETQPLDYSLSDATIHKDTTSLNGPTENGTYSDSSEDSCNINAKVDNKLENVNYCPLGISISNNARQLKENYNAEPFSLKEMNGSIISNSEFICETGLMAEKSKDDHQVTNVNGESSIVEDSISSDKSNFESDFDVSDSEPNNEKETIAKEGISAIDGCHLNEEMDSDCTLRNEQLLTVCPNKEKESIMIEVDKTQETKDQSILRVDHHLPKEPDSVTAISTKDDPVTEYIEQNSISINHDGHLTTKESLLLNSHFKDVNTHNNGFMTSLSKEESVENKFKNLKDVCSFKPSEDKTNELLTVTSIYNGEDNEGSMPLFHADERSETSVIVRNNTFTSIINNQGKESSSKYRDKMESNVKNHEFSSTQSILNKEINDISSKNEEQSVLPDLEENQFEESTINNSHNNSEKCQLTTHISNDDNNIPVKTNEDESMEIESPSIFQSSDNPGILSTSDDISVETEDISVANKSFEEESENLKLSYCVSESIFLNIDDESVSCLKKSCPSYLFDFKRRKLLKFRKSVHQPQFTFSKNSTNYNRDFSIINFGLNVSQQVCSSSAAESNVAYPMSERSHCDNTQTETNNKITELVDEINPVPLSKNEEHITDPLQSHFNPSEPFDPSYVNNKNEKCTVTKLQGDLIEEESAVLKPNKNMVHLKSKLCLPQEVNSLCIRRDSLKLLEPDAVLKEIFSPDPDLEDSESKENYFSANYAKDKHSTNNSEKLGLAPIICTSLASLHSDSRVGNKWNTINSPPQNFADVNCNLLNSDKGEPLVSTDLSVCILEENYKIDDNIQSKQTNKNKDVTETFSNRSKTESELQNKICKEQLPFICADGLNEKEAIKDQQNSKTSSIVDCSNLNISCTPLNKIGSESHGYLTDSLTHLNQPSLLCASKSVECSEHTSASSTFQDEGNYEEDCPESKVKNIEEHSSHEDQRITENLTDSSPQDTQTLSCQISKFDNQENHMNGSDEAVSSMTIVTGRDVLFSSRFHEDEEDKELNSELQNGNRSRKSSVEEESILDCQNIKINSQDPLRGGSGHLSSETFPLQCLVDAALALENVDSKQMILNSSTFSGIYSQSSQSLIKSTIDDVHPNDIEDFPEKNSFSSSNPDPNLCKENQLSAADRAIFSKFEENNYNLRASTKIVTSSSSNIIPYSKRYYKFKSQKRPKPPLEKLNKSENLIKKSQTKKRKEVFSYPRSKRRKKGVKDKSKYQQLKKQQDLFKKSSGNNHTQISSTDGSIQSCENEMIFEEPPSSSKIKREEEEDYFQSPNTNQSAESYNLGSNQSLSGKSNFGGPLIIASENSPAESNIFCVHVNSDKMDEYVHDLNVGGLDLLSEHNQSDFKDNSIEEHSETPDVTLENGTSLVIIIEQLGENGEKDNYYNTCKRGPDVILGGIEERSPLPQPNSVLDYSSDNMTSEVSINESCICPSDFDSERNCQRSLFKDSKSLESESSILYKNYEVNSGKFEGYEKYSAECNQELLTTNCYEEINETLVNDIGNWPFVEEEVAEFNTKSVSPDRIPEEGRKIELKCSLPWNKIFNMTKTKKKKYKASHKVSGLELGPAKVEVRLRAPSTEWKVISDYAENSSPVVKVSRLILQRESETSSYSEKDSEEENENRKLLSPLSTIMELKDNLDSNCISKNLIEDESWQPVVLLTRDKELDEFTRSRNRCKELDKVNQPTSEEKESVEQLLSEQTSVTEFSSINNEDDSESESSEIVSEESRVDSNSSDLKSSGNVQNSFENIETDLFDNLPEKRNVDTRYQNTKTEKGCTYETYSPSRHGGSNVEETIYSPSDPHFSPEPSYHYSDSSSFGDKKKSDMSGESDISYTENYYNCAHQEAFGSFDTLKKDATNEENDTCLAGCFKIKSSSGSPENVNIHDSETSDTNYSSETQISSLFDKGSHYVAGTDSLPLRNVHQVNSQYVRPDLLDTPNIISNEIRKSNIKTSVAEENLRKFKRKMPKNFFVRRKFKKNADHQNNATQKMLLEEKDCEGKPGCSLLPDDDSFPCLTENTPRQRRSPNSSEIESVPNEWQTGQGSALIEERLKSTKSDLSLNCENSSLPCLDDSYSLRLNDSPLGERFEEKLRLRDGGRGLKRPCEGHSKEDTKRRRKNLGNHPNKCQECDAQFETKEELSRHVVRDHTVALELHHCLLCQRSFSSAARHRLHMQGRSHRHLELTQRHAIHAVHRLLKGEDCPRIPPLSGAELQALQWRPTQPGYSHFYHQIMPLQTALQEHDSEASEEVVAGGRRTSND